MDVFRYQVTKKGCFVLSSATFYGVFYLGALYSCSILVIFIERTQNVRTISEDIYLHSVSIRHSVRYQREEQWWKRLAEKAQIRPYESTGADGSLCDAFLEALTWN